MKKNGFTMAEILIVLAVIGVIASLTIPAIITKQKSSQIGTKLSKARQLILAANEQYLLEEEVDDLTVISGDKYLSGIATKLKNAHKGEYDASGKMINKDVLYIPSGAVLKLVDTPGTDPCKLSTTTPAKKENGKIVEEEKTTMNGSYRGEIACLEVNITRGNGTVVGRDLFYFVIDKTGAVVPYGSTMLGSQETACDANNPDATTKNNKGCAGIIYENNWKLPSTYAVPKKN